MYLICRLHLAMKYTLSAWRYHWVEPHLGTHVAANSNLPDYDILHSMQQIGVKRGLLCPERVLFCSPAVKRMIDEEKLSGFEFEIARIE